MLNIVLSRTFNVRDHVIVSGEEMRQTKVKSGCEQTVSPRRE